MKSTIYLKRRKKETIITYVFLKLINFEFAELKIYIIKIQVMFVEVFLCYRGTRKIN